MAADGFYTHVYDLFFFYIDDSDFLQKNFYSVNTLGTRVRQYIYETWEMLKVFTVLILPRLLVFLCLFHIVLFETMEFCHCHDRRVVKRTEKLIFSLDCSKSRLISRWCLFYFQMKTSPHPPSGVECCISWQL